MIDIQNLTKRYPNQHCVLHALSLQIPNGMFGLLGPNGAGKTTLMRILATLLRPSAGRVTVFGNDLATPDGRDKTRNMLGYLPQDTGLHPELTVEQELDYIAILKRIADPAARARQIAEVLEKVGLADVRGVQVRTLSGGMKRRLGIALVLLGNPRLIIVDEPTAGLDPAERVRFRNLLYELAGERVIILSTHIVEDVNHVCSDLAILHRGALRFRGAPQELTGKLKGKLWSVSGNGKAPGVEMLEIAVKIGKDGLERRVVCEQAPDPAAAPVDPSLEDAYLWQVAAG
ncbi:MAG: ABC transporter ATP-binding protein [Chloroflexota bacterium]